MNSHKASKKDFSELSILNINDQRLAQTLKRVEHSVEKRFDKIEFRNEKMNLKIQILSYFLVTDIIFCFLILGTMRGWF